MNDVPLDLYAGVVGQDRAVDQLRRAVAAPVHAYLLVGPAGSTKDEAARAFAVELLGGHGARDDRLALAGEHPDIREVVRIGPAISAEQAREVVRLAALAPVEGERKVLILHELHLLRPEGAALLLKTIEEPPPSTAFVVLADFVPADLVTVASRCVRIEFRSIPDDLLAARLVHEGVAADVASAVAAAAGGDLTRARILAVDPSFAARRAAFATIPQRLDGSGATVIRLAAEVLDLIEQAAAPLIERQATEAGEVAARAEQLGERGSGRKQLEERHRRQLRRHRVDELRSGLGALARAYRDLLVAGVDPGHGSSDTYAAAVDRIHAVLQSLEHNPNEALLLQSLFWSLPAAPA